MAVEAETRQALIKKFQRNGADTGSPEVQVALLTERIKSLTQHLIAAHGGTASPVADASHTN